MRLEQLGRNSNAEQEYLNSPLTRFVRQMRGNNNDFSGVNYASFFYRHNNAGPYQVTASSGRYHSEKHCWLQLCQVCPAFTALSVNNWREGSYGGALTPAQLYYNSGTYIECVYTERDACSACSPLLNEILLPNAMVYWSFVYPSKDTSKFEQPPEQVAVFALLTFEPNLLAGAQYEDVVNQNVRTGRKLGNSALASSMNSL